jgi:hypothetical protein
LLLAFLRVKSQLTVFLGHPSSAILEQSPKH